MQSTIHFKSDSKFGDFMSKNAKVCSTFILLKRCSNVLMDGEVVSLSEKLKCQIMAENTKMCSQALRVICLAFKPCEQLVEDEFIFLGLCGFI